MYLYKDEHRISIPDEKFRRILSDKYGISFDANETISYGDIKQIRDLEVSNSEITNLEGIEYFSSLQILSCGGNALTSLDISQNSELEKLNCPNNRLKELDISQNPNLQVLVCNENEFESLNVSQNFKLRSLYVEKEIEVQYT
tara:strand:- start:14962 stop:15390 length:429 start_codon:yes stop_codon:yes gene_type:complete